jgi:hypothetical protein
LVVTRVIPLLPGLCAVIFGSMVVSEARVESGVVPLVAVGLVVGFFGLVMIWATFRSPRP